MDAKEFFKKLEGGELEGEPLETVEDICKYLESPVSHKVYNTLNENYVKGLAEILNSAKKFEARVIENSDKKLYQLGIFYKNGSE